MGENEELRLREPLLALAVDIEADGTALAPGLVEKIQVDLAVILSQLFHNVMLTIL